MEYGICHLSMVPLKIDASDTSGMINQLLYGEYFEILEQRLGWSRIRAAADANEGWVDNKQFLKLSEENFQQLESEELVLTADLIEFISDEHQHLMPIPLGSTLNFLPGFQHHYDGGFVSGKKSKEELINTAFFYLNAPSLWGGRTPFGIDCSGLVQMVYKLNGYRLSREVKQQALQGESLSFIEESEPGDLAFFDNREGEINHVGIMMSDNYIIHSHGKVRIDRIDHSGIYNEELGKHTHQLRVIKKIV